MQRQWLSAGFDIPSFCAYETRKTFGLSVVTQASASNLCNRRLDPIDADHLTIVKPSGDRAASYLAFSSALAQTRSIVPPSDNQDLILASARSFDRASAEASQGYVGTADGDVHTAFVFLNLDFADEQFNRPAFMKSFNKVAARVRSRFDSDWQPVDAGLFACSGPSALTCVLRLAFKTEPAVGSDLEVQFGPVTKRQSILAGTFRWKPDHFDRDGSSVPWSVAISEVQYKIGRITWAVLSDAEILEGSGGASLLRVTVTNPTDLSATIQSLRLTAGKPVRSNISCFAGDPVQSVKLKWQRVASGQPPTASTVLHGVDVPVDVDYNFSGMCNHYYSMSIRIPMTDSVGPHSQQQIFLKIDELPPGTGDRPGGAARTARETLLYGPPVAGPPAKLSQWPDVRLEAVGSEGTLFSPSVLQIRGSPAR